MSLGQFVSLQRGHDLPSERRGAGEVPVMGSFGVSGHHHTARAKGPGVIVGRSGASAGVVSFCPVDYWPLNTCLFATAFHGNNPKFVYYFLTTMNLGSYNSGSAQPSLNRNHIAPIPIRVPPRDEQDAIVQVLGSLDDKIELNRRMNETLEAMAQAIFRDWFVDFGPVRRKMEGATDPVAIMGGVTTDAARASELAALFPGSLGAHDLPSGWEYRRVDDLLELAYGKSLPKPTRIPGAVPVYGSGGVGGYHAEALVSGPGLIIGRKGTVGSLYWEPGDFFPIDTVFYVRPRGQIPFVYLWQVMLTLGLPEMNTDAAVPGLNRDNVYRLTVPWPDFDVVHALAALLGTIRAKLDQGIAENQTLAETRDYLLPRLMSGEVRVGQPEALAQAAE